MKYSAQTKSFVVLVILALAGCYICLYLMQSLPSYNNKNFYANDFTQNQIQDQASQEPAAPILPPLATEAQLVNTANWKTYTSSKYGISFNYDPTWKVLNPTTSGDYNVIQVDPGKKYYNIKIYVSKNSYYIINGIPVTGDYVGGQYAENVNDALFGVKYNNLYYTFDIGLSMSLLPQFNALVNSVTFSNPQ